MFNHVCNQPHIISYFLDIKTNNFLNQSKYAISEDVYLFQEQVLKYFQGHLGTYGVFSVKRTIR